MTLFFCIKEHFYQKGPLTNTQESSNTDVVEASNKTELSENHIFQNSLIYNLKKS